MALSSSKTVLVVESTAAIRSTISFLLRNRGFEVIEATDGDEAMEEARAHGPDLIILDTLMPGSTGFDLCSSLKSDENMRGIPVLMLIPSVGAGKSNEEWKKLSGADGFVSKPLKAHDLLERVERLIGRQDTSRIRKQSEGTPYSLGAGE